MFRSSLMFLGLLYAAPVAAQTPASERPKVVLVRYPGANSPNLNATIDQLVVQPLRAEARIPPAKGLQRGMQLAGIRGAQKKTQEGVLAIAAALNASYAVLLSTEKVAVDGGGATPGYELWLRGYEVASGAATGEKRIALVGAKLPPKVAKEARAAFLELLSPPAPQVDLPEVDAEAATADDTPSEPLLEFGDEPPAPEPAPDVAAEVAPEMESDAEAAVDTGVAEPELVEAPPEPTVVELPADDAEVGTSGRARPYLQARGGLRLMWRRADVSDASPLQPASYLSSAPIAMGHIDAEFYPLGLGAKGRFC